MRIIVSLTLMALVFSCVCYTNTASFIRPSDFDVDPQLQQQEGLLEETLTAIETGRQPRTIGVLVLLDFLLSRILNAIIEQNNQNGAPDDNQDQVVF
uniref:Uncharacterized protein n=1 Tax=Glossina pallidipes TaxID=7398 RepID=A0A1B0A7W7_GLOPL